MARLVVINDDGSERELPGAPGLTVMEIMRDGGVDDVLAMCGGCGSCGTCHIYVGSGYQGLLPPLSGAEAQVLEGLDNRTACSRLSCQIPWENGLDGLRVTVAVDNW